MLPNIAPYCFLTVTCEHNKLVIIRKVVDGHIGEGGDDLLLRRQVGALLELEIANSTGQGEVAVHTAKVDEATGCADSCLFTYYDVSGLRTRLR